MELKVALIYICPIYLIFHRLVQIVNEKVFEMVCELVNKHKTLLQKGRHVKHFED